MRTVMAKSSANERGLGVRHEPSRDASAASQSVLDATRSAAHSHCLLCGAENVQGLGLDFQALPDGSVRAVFAGSGRHAGYPGTLHGGLIAALLDSAMTNCLFARGIVAVTARLNVRYLQPGQLGTPLDVVATLLRSSRSLHYLCGELQQNGSVVAAATATFKDRTRRPLLAAGVAATAWASEARGPERAD